MLSSHMQLASSASQSGHQESHPSPDGAELGFTARGTSGRGQCGSVSRSGRREAGRPGSDRRRRAPPPGRIPNSLSHGPYGRRAGGALGHTYAPDRAQERRPGAPTRGYRARALVNPPAKHEREREDDRDHNEREPRKVDHAHASMKARARTGSSRVAAQTGCMVASSSRRSAGLIARMRRALARIFSA